MKFRRFYDLRTDNDKTQQNIADYLICNRNVYARYESGIREIPVSMVIKLAKYYNVSTDYILGLSDVKNPY
ncbi:MAG: helix-turn-helix transcriptional regulator [Oscillospiraceae bacterium]